LIKWKKEFAVKNVIGKDVVKLLKDAIKRNGVSVFVNHFWAY